MVVVVVAIVKAIVVVVGVVALMEGEATTVTLAIESLESIVAIERVVVGTAATAEGMVVLRGGIPAPLPPL